MAALITLTLNPAVDVSTATDRVTDTHKLRCEAAQFHPGGGGINVARVAHRLGVGVRALYTAGGVNGAHLSQLLQAEQVPGQVIAIAGETRESFTVHEISSGLDYRFVLPGPTLTPSEWQAALDAVAQACSEAPARTRYLVASGSLPPGVPADFYAQLARRARQLGLRFVLDASGAALAAGVGEGVYLVKPSQRELEELVGQSLDTPQAQEDAARSLVRQGRADWVALSLGPRGALLVGDGLTLRSPALHVPVRSTVGAGDSFVGGLVAALARGQEPAQALAHGMATAAAALLSPGTALCTPPDVQQLLPQVVVTRD